VKLKHYVITVQYNNSIWSSLLWYPVSLLLTS